jgi:hypothetical protein
LEGALELRSLRSLPPGCTHTESLGSSALGGSDGVDDFLDRKQRFPRDAGGVMRGLRAIAAVFRAASRFNRKEEAALKVLPGASI